MKHKNKKTLLAVIILLAVLAAGMAGTGCGAPEQEREKQLQAGAQSIPDSIWEDQTFAYFQENPVNNGEPVELTMWGNEDWKESYSYLIEQYRKYRPNVEIKLTCFPWKSYRCV